MQYDGLGVVIALSSLLIMLVALRVLAGGLWLLAWLRGTLGMLVFALSLVVGLAAWDVSRYAPLPADRIIATLSFQSDGQQRYRVEIDSVSESANFILEGDLWQFDIHMLQWKGLAKLIGLEPGFRLGEITGRYLAVEQQEQTQHPRVVLNDSFAGTDIWQAIRRCQCASQIIEAQLKRSSYLPIAQGAVYSIDLSPTGLLARPLNREAEQALKDWQ